MSVRAQRGRSRSLRSFADLRKVEFGYDIPPALTFMPSPPRPAGAIRRNQARPIDESPPRRPESTEELAFLPVSAAFRPDPKPAVELDGADQALYRASQAI